MTLRTNADAKRYVLAKLESRSGYQSWKHAAELLVHGGSPDQVARQIEYVLLLDGQLDVKYAKEQRS